MIKTCISSILRISADIMEYKKNLPALTGQFEIISFKPKFGERNVTHEGGSWKYEGLHAVSEHIWEISAGGHKWKLKYPINASGGLKVTAMASMVEETTKTEWTLNKNYMSHPLEWSNKNEIMSKYQHGDIPKAQLKKYESEIEKYKKLKGIVNDISENFEDYEKKLDIYILNKLKCSIVVDKEDNNYLYYELDTNKALIQLHPKDRVAIAVNGAIEKDKDKLTKIKELILDLIGVYSFRNKLKIDVKYVANFKQQEIEGPKHKELEHKACVSSILKYRIAGKLQKIIDKTKGQNDKPFVFLGGSCDDDNAWRKEVIKEFGDSFSFVDPYDPDWDPEENIYEELAAILNADIVLFYKGGQGTKKEKKFMDNADKEYKVFDDLDELKEHLTILAEQR